MNMDVIKKCVYALVITTSPAFRTLLESAVRDLYCKALNTENPFDDWFVEFLACLVGIDLHRKE